MEKAINALIGLFIVALIGIAIFFTVVNTVPSARLWWQSINANVDREVFENTKPFVAGTIQELRRYKLDYDTAKDDATKSTILAAAREMSSEIDYNKLPEDLRSWLQSSNF